MLLLLGFLYAGAMDQGNSEALAQANAEIERLRGVIAAMDTSGARSGAVNRAARGILMTPNPSNVQIASRGLELGDEEENDQTGNGTDLILKIFTYKIDATVRGVVCLWHTSNSHDV